jgi:glutamate N-acetyltransferase/amino-acid N-acetyltransferase
VSGAGGPEHPVVVRPHDSVFLHFPEGVRLVEEAGASPGVTYPRGFVAAGIAGGIKVSGRKDVGVVAAAPSSWSDTVGAAVFTRNSFAAAPVVVSRKETSIASLAAVVMNSGNANACTGGPGLSVAREMQQTCARVLGLAQPRVAVASTGVIGVPLDAELVSRAVETAALGVTPDGGPAFAESIMTTDRFPKQCALEVTTRDGVVRLAGAAKGAGMIAPGMATMLCVVTTDAYLEPALARSLLSREVGRTFNRISVDGQMSTNDCVFLLANGASGVHLSPDGGAGMSAGLRTLLLRLALMMVADGEGATMIVRLRVRGAAGDEDARVATRAVADSTLVKTAMYGRDPNWGRILSAVGAALPGRLFPEVSLDFGPVRLVEGGLPTHLEEGQRAALSAHMAGTEVDVLLDLGAGPAKDEVFFSDLGHEYVTINAEYHT